MNADVAADQLRALASRVRRNVPMNSDPHRFHEEASEIAHDIVALAEHLAPSAGVRSGRVERPNGEKAKVAAPGFKGRTIVTTHIIAGRRVAVQQRRKPFAIHV